MRFPYCYIFNVKVELVMSVAKGYVVLPKSVTPSRIAANIKGPILAYKALTKEDIAKLDSVAAAGKQKRYVFLFSSRDPCIGSNHMVLPPQTHHASMG